MFVPCVQVVSAPVMDTSDMDPELARYLNRNYWQQKSENIKTTSVVTTTTPSAPVAVAETKNTQGGGKIHEVGNLTLFIASTRTFCVW